jgi:hypothetical protein
LGTQHGPNRENLCAGGCHWSFIGFVSVFASIAISGGTSRNFTGFFLLVAWTLLGSLAVSFAIGA